MGRNLRRAGLATLLSTLALTALAGCGKSDLLQKLNQFSEAISSPTQIKFAFCTDPAYAQKQYLKTIIILDHSGSNQQNYLMAADGSGAPQLVAGVPVINASYATDPLGYTRYGQTTTPGTLLNYLNGLPANDVQDPTKFFALIDFSNSATTYPPSSAGFTSNIGDFYTHVLADSKVSGTAPADGGSTDYLGALTAAYHIMTADIQAAQTCAALPLGSASPGAWCPTPGKQIASSYVIVFMSDGSPITNLSGIGVDANGNIVVTGQIGVTKEATTDILAQVSTIAALTSNAAFVTAVNLFTIYYYAPGNIDLGGQTLLANMARAGNGISYNALSGSNIDYSQFQPPAKRIKYKLSDVFVTNGSVTWWTDNALHPDTDRDGLPDDVEVAWGSDPKKADSDNNGVSDFVEYQLAHGAARTATVNYAGAACSSIAHQTVNGAVVFKQSDPDGLNDCEKTLLSNVSGIGNADSNGDLIADFLEFKAGLPFQTSSLPSISVRDQDGLTIYQKIKWSLPINVPSTQLLSFTPAKYDLRLLTSDANQDCYNLNVSNLPRLNANDMVRIDVFENSELLQTPPLYRVGQKSFAGSDAVSFADWKDPAEIAAKTWSVPP